LRDDPLMVGLLSETAARAAYYIERVGTALFHGVIENSCDTLREQFQETRRPKDTSGRRARCCWPGAPRSLGHSPNLPSSLFKGKSRIGQYGDKMMEGDYHVGQILDALKQLGVDQDTLLVFASDNGPWSDAAREFGNQGSPDVGNAGPFRGELGEVTEGSIR